MSDNPDHVFQCQYCGRKATLDQAIIAWAAEDWRSVGDETMFTVQVTCSRSCAQHSNDIRVMQ